MKGKTTTAHAIGAIGRTIGVVLVSSIVIHLFVMAIDYLTIKKPLYLDLQNDFIGGAFSFPMLPMIAAYGILILGTYLLWFKVKKTILRANETELERVKAQSVIEAMQRTSKLLAQHITENNNAILLWLHDKKERKQKIPSVVENSCNNISMALQALNKFSYVIPYDRSRPENSPDEMEKKLEMELKSTTYS